MASRVIPAGRSAANGGWVTLGIVLGATALTAVSAMAAPVGAPEAATMRGVPVAQNFLHDHGDNVSLVATADGVSCVASRALPIHESIYRDAEGATVAFEDVVRSPASSVQAIARGETPPAFRIQLKYTPDADAPITLKVGPRAFELRDNVEPSGDSLWLTDDLAMVLTDAFAAGEAVLLDARSAGTGRRVTDRIDPPSLAGLADCLDTLSELEAAEAEALAADENVPDAVDAPAPILASAPVEGRAEVVIVEDAPAEAKLPVPVAGVRLELTARADPELRVTDEQLAACRMRDIPEDVYLGRLNGVSGFFSQTSDVYVAFDEEGRLQRAYVPGIFDSDLSEGVNTARLSLAADSNVPDRANTVRGCLGEAVLAASICVYPDEAADTYVLAECGVMGVSDDRDEPLFAWATPVTPAAAGIGSGTFVNPPARGGSTPPGRVSFAPGGGGGGGSTTPPNLTPFPPPNGENPPNGHPPGGEPPSGPPPGTPDIPSVPLPAAVWLLLGALGGLSGLRFLQRG